MIKIAENELPERSPASKTPHNLSLALSRGPSALILTTDLAVATPRPQEAQNGENAVSNIFC